MTRLAVATTQSITSSDRRSVLGACGLVKWCHDVAAVRRRDWPTLAIFGLNAAWLHTLGAPVALPAAPEAHLTPVSPRPAQAELELKVVVFGRLVARRRRRGRLSELRGGRRPVRGGQVARPRGGSFAFSSCVSTALHRRGATGIPLSQDPSTCLGLPSTRPRPGTARPRCTPAASAATSPLSRRCSTPSGCGSRRRAAPPRSPSTPCPLRSRCSSRICCPRSSTRTTRRAGHAPSRGARGGRGEAAGGGGHAGGRAPCLCLRRRRPVNHIVPAFIIRGSGGDGGAGGILVLAACALTSKACRLRAATGGRPPPRWRRHRSRRLCPTRGENN